MPLYCLAFVLTGGATRQDAGSRITEPNALAILAGFMTAAAVSLNVFYMQSPYSTAVWQFFPVWAAITQQLYLLHHPSTKTSPSGHNVIQAAYLVSMFASAYIHLATVVPLVSDLDALKELFLPVIDVGSAASIEMGLKNLIKWDMILGMGALQLCTLWFARSTKECLTIVFFNVVGTVVLGPGGIFAGVMMWREARLGRAVESSASLESDVKL